MRLLRWFARLVYPPKCILCRTLLEKDELDLCHRCRIDSPELSDSRMQLTFIHSWTAVWYYEDQVRRSLLRYKFRKHRHYAPAYGRLLAMKVLNWQDSPFDLITWVPISPWRKLCRGYDQVELLADTVCRELGAEPVRCLRKVRHNPPQSGIREYSHRRANVLGVYEPVTPERFRGKRVLLLDDIITTGATVSECARVLLTSGAREVHCAAVAAARHSKQSGAAQKAPKNNR